MVVVARDPFDQCVVVANVENYPFRDNGGALRTHHRYRRFRAPAASFRALCTLDIALFPSWLPAASSYGATTRHLLSIVSTTLVCVR